ncbi:hypothetical protein Q3G72_029387 [Acer saccharum]|nr:hypothetical protein Q3G72_029387 [Acer saccharum]
MDDQSSYEDSFSASVDVLFPLGSSSALILSSCSFLDNYITAWSFAASGSITGPLESGAPITRPYVALKRIRPEIYPSLLTEGGDEAREYEWLLVYLYAPQLKNLPLDQETNVDQLIMKNAMKDRGCIEIN